MRDLQSFVGEIVITVPLRASDPEDICDRLDDAVEQAVAGLGGTAMYDGTGHGDDVFELFIWADDVDGVAAT